MSRFKGACRRGSLVLLILGFLIAVPVVAADRAAGRVESVQGQADLMRDDVWQRVQAGQPVEAGDRIRTGSDGMVVISLGEHKIRLGPDALLVIDRADSENERFGLALLLGRLWAFVVKGAQAIRFEVETPAAIAGVRGTLFSVSVARDGATWLGVAEGVVAFSALDGSPAIDVPAGYKSTLVPGGKPAKPQKVKPGEVGGEDLKPGKEKEDKNNAKESNERSGRGKDESGQEQGSGRGKE